MDEEKFYEYDISGKICLKCLNNSQITKIIRQDNNYYGIELLFQDRESLYYEIDSFKRDRIISDILHCLSLKGKGEIDLCIELISSRRPDLGFKIKGFLNNECDNEYELDLLNKVLSFKRDENFHDLIKEMILNINLKTYNANDNKPLCYIFEKIASLLNVYTNTDFLNYIEMYECYLLYNNYKENNKDEKLSAKLGKYKDFYLNKYNQFIKMPPSKIHNITIDKQSIRQLCYNIEELLKVLTVLLTGSFFYKEIAYNKKDDFYEKSLSKISVFLDSPNQLLCYLTSNLFKIIFSFPNNLEYKAETLNKSMLINGSTQIVDHLLDTITLKFINRDSMRELERNSLALFGLLRLLTRFLIEKKDTTSIDDRNKIIKKLSDQTVIIMLSTFNCLKAKSVIFRTSALILSILEVELTKTNFNDFQNFLLENTVLLPLHFKLNIFGDNYQRNMSLSLLHYLVTNNSKNCNIISRFIPKNFIKCNKKTLVNWKIPEWEDLYSRLIRDWNRSTDQWNEITRKELKNFLDLTEKKFNCYRRNLLENELDNNTGNSLENTIESIKNLNWNHNDLWFEYKSLKEMILIGDYYLNALVLDKEIPELNGSIIEISKFWTELNYSFISTNNLREKIKILKTMILIYKIYYQEIGEYSAIPYWIELMHNSKEISLKYLIIQFIYIILTRKNMDITRFNTNKFIENNGLNSIFCVLISSIVSENNQTFEKIIENIYNYTDSNFISNHNNSIFQIKTNTSLFLLNILIILMEKNPIHEKKELFPIRIIKEKITNPIYIEILMDCLFNQSEEISNLVLFLIETQLLDKQNYIFISEFSGFFDFLTSKITKNNIETIINIINKLYNRLLEDHKQINYIKMYTAFSFEDLANPTIQKSIHFFPFLKFFPKNLIWRLFNVSSKEFTNILFSENFEDPSLIWSKTMKDRVFSLLNSHLSDHFSKILVFLEENPIIILENLPRYIDNFNGPINHEEIDKEVRCGPLFLRVWNKPEFKDFVIGRNLLDKFIRLLIEKISNFLNKIQSENKKELDENIIQDLIVILKAHSKAIKRYKIQNYSSFDEILFILQTFSGSKQFLMQDCLLSIALKSIFRAISIDLSGNLENFIKRDGFICVFKCFLSIINRLNNLKWNLNDFKAVSKILKIFLIFFDKAKDQILNSSLETQNQFFLLLQKTGSFFLDYLNDKNSNNLDIKNDLTNKEKTNNNIEVEEENKQNTEIFEENSQKFDASSPKIPIIDKNISEEIRKINKKLIFSEEKENIPLWNERKVIESMRDYIRILKYCSIETSLLSNMAKSGQIWVILQFCLNCGEIKQEEMKEILVENVSVLRNILLLSYNCYIICELASKKLILDELTDSKASLNTTSVLKLSIIDREILFKLYEKMCLLLLKPNISNLLSGKFEVSLSKDIEETKQSANFLRILNENTYNFQYLWDKTYREDLLLLLESQINSINEGFDWLNRLEDYQYANNFNELTVEDVFVSVYNNNPQIKLPNPIFFLKSLFIEIEKSFQSIEKRLIFNYKNTNSIRLRKGENFYAFHLIEGLKGIYNIYVNIGHESIILEKNNFSILTKIIQKQAYNNDFFKDKNINSLIGLQLIKILRHLTLKTQGIILLLQSKILILALLKILRRNEIITKIDIYEIFVNISNQSHLFTFLGKLGFITSFFEMLMKTEIFENKIREKFYELLIKFFDDKDGFNQIIMGKLFGLIPEEIRKNKFLGKVFIELIDGEQESPFFEWTKIRRQEIWMILKEINDKIEEKIEGYESDEITLDTKIEGVFNILKEDIKVELPEIKDEIMIKNVIIRNYVKYSNCPLPINLADFIQNLAEISDKIFISLNKNLNNSPIDLSNEIMNKCFHDFLIVLSAILLALEQYVFHRAYIQKTFMEKSPQHADISKENQKILIENQQKIDQKFVVSLYQWLSSLKETSIHPHLRTILLQIFLISTEIESFSFENTTSLLDLLVFLLENTLNLESELGFLDEILILHILLKLMLKDRKLIGLFCDKGINLIFIIMESSKQHLSNICENILGLMYKDLEFGEKVGDILSKKIYINLETTFEKIKARDYNFTEIWRIYDSKGDFSSHLEKTLGFYATENEIDSISLPIVSEIILNKSPHCDEEIKKKIAEIRDFAMKEKFDSSE